MKEYILISAVVFLILGIIFKKNNWTNLIAKILFLGIGLVGLFIWLQLSGYIVKA